MSLKLPTPVFGLALLAGLAADLALAQEAVVILRSTVTGNQEQPRVMYIVPWQQPGPTDFEYTPGSGLAQDLFTHIEREEFVRELDYRALLANPGGDTTDVQ
ncbi:MAG: hypothetical protein O7F73_18235 [Gammaproteobacteria bacterium]|nr:hypothetical protein [Gammaproteobacteria bacterium]